MHTQQRGKRWSVDRRADTTKTDAWQALINRKVAAELLDLDKHIGWTDSMVLDQLVCRRTVEGWLVIIKAHRNGARRAAFVSGATYTEALELAGEFAARGCLTWQKDKWPPKRLEGKKP